MKITILGSGSSGGVPLIGNDWGACDPNNPRNRRQRVSVLVEEGGATVLIDTSPDARAQLLGCGLKTLTAVLYTHTHADHTHGIDDLRSVNWLTQKPIPIYGDAKTLEDLKMRFDYVFGPHKRAHDFSRPLLEPHVIDGPFRINEVLNVIPVHQRHGKSEHSLGFRFNDFAYSTDADDLDDAAFEALAGVKTWVVGCIRRESHHTHAHLEKVLGWIARLKPERAYLTHMDHSMDYATLTGQLPSGVAPAYDGLILEC